MPISAIFFGSECVTKLLYLNFSDCSSLNDECINSLTANCPNMHSLNLGKCPRISENGIDYIFHRLKQLKFLDITTAEKASCVALLDQIGKNCLPKLIYLNLYYSLCGSKDLDECIQTTVQRNPNLILVLDESKVFHSSLGKASSGISRNLCEYFVRGQIDYCMGSCCMSVYH